MGFSPTASKKRTAARVATRAPAPRPAARSQRRSPTIRLQSANRTGNRTNLGAQRTARVERTASSKAAPNAGPARVR